MIITYNAEIFLYNQWRPKEFFLFEILTNVLVVSPRFIWTPMLWVYTDIINIIILSSRGPSLKVRSIWRLQSSNSDVYRRSPCWERSTKNKRKIFPPALGRLVWWHAQQTHDVESLLIYRWSTVYDVVSTLIQHWFSISRLLGSDVSDADVLVCRTLASTVFWGLRCRSRAQLEIATWRLIRATASEMITAAFDDD